MAESCILCVELFEGSLTHIVLIKFSVMPGNLSPFCTCKLFAGLWGTPILTLPVACVCYQVKEVFGSGTACIVCPVEKIMYLGEQLDIPTMKDAKITNRFHKQLSDIQVWGL